MNGKKLDVLIEKTSSRSLYVWANEHMLDAIKSVGGVFSAGNDCVEVEGKTLYHVYIKRGYDIDSVIAEVETAINRLIDNWESD